MLSGGCPSKNNYHFIQRKDFRAGRSRIVDVNLLAELTVGIIGKHLIDPFSRQTRESL